VAGALFLPFVAFPPFLAGDFFAFLAGLFLADLTRFSDPDVEASSVSVLAFLLLFRDPFLRSML
jgi:hypothetical protein